MEVVIDWSSSCGFISNTGKRMQQMVSETSILRGERRLGSRQSDAGITVNRWEAHWRRMDAKLDELKKEILDLSFSTQGRSVETTDASSCSRGSHVRAESECRSCSSDLDPTDCNLSPIQKTEEHKVRGIDSETYFLSFSHDTMNYFVGNSIGVSELSTRGDDSLIEQPSNIMEEESTMSLKDAIVVYVEEFVNSMSSSMKFDVAARASFDVKVEGLVDEEKEVSKEISMGEFLCMCKGIDGKYVQMDRTFDAFLLLDSVKVPESSQMELVKVPMTSKMVVQNPSKCGWLVLNWFTMPKVKMKTEKASLGNLITAPTQEFGEGIPLMDDAPVFLTGKVTRVVVASSFFFIFGVDTGNGEILDRGKVNGIKLEQYVVSLLDNNQTFPQAKEIKETKRLPFTRRNASVRELATTWNAVRNLTRLRVRYPKPLVKMKFIVVPVDSCRVFKGGGMTRATHMQVQYGEVIGGKLGKKFDLDKGRLQRVARGLRADDCDGNFKFTDDAVFQTSCGLSERMKEPNVSSSPALQILILGLIDGMLEVFLSYW